MDPMLEGPVIKNGTFRRIHSGVSHSGSEMRQY
jgi:hypothetical protein